MGMMMMQEKSQPDGDGGGSWRDAVRVPLVARRCKLVLTEAGPEISSSLPVSCLIRFFKVYIQTYLLDSVPSPPCTTSGSQLLARSNILRILGTSDREIVFDLLRLVDNVVVESRGL